MWMFELQESIRDIASKSFISDVAYLGVRD